MTNTAPQLIFAPGASISHQWEDIWPPAYDLTSNRHTYAEDLQWNRVSNLFLNASASNSRPYHLAIKASKYLIDDHRANYINGYITNFCLGMKELH
ncbi:hypothetical protein AVEN_37141-1 [Araneus ventricosus]|uniref:Uncharacterized protein n=1 Tax=Araneus ventricosus TaxID=182803 RepID=A0A4Y2HB48_ARAVE|nr:hypothetical protein AVEN_37141-1 [Araneus ventricosus]